MNKITSIFNNLTQLQKSLAVSILSVLLFVVSAGISYSQFSGGKVSITSHGLVATLPGPSNSVTESPDEPKTEECPLNGSRHTKAARDSWEKRIPLAVMIENHQEARPQSGLSYADVVYETVAEGGITRFMAVFYCNLEDVQVGPVRSARTYFLDWESEYKAMYAHVGGANTPGPADALGQIIKYDINDLNQFSIGFPTFWRDYQRLGHAVATEHTMYSTTQKLWEVGAKRGFTNPDKSGIRWAAGFTPWKFKDDSASSQTKKISVPFWSNQPNYDVVWNYSGDCNCYMRENGGEKHIDMDTKKQLSAKNVVVQFERESNANDGYENNVHLLYGTIGSGKALFFMDGKVIEGKWSKASRTSRTRYSDLAGREISFNHGLIWIQTVPEGAKVSY